MEKIILATTSPRRKSLASQMGLDFEIMPSDYEEDMSLNLNPKELVKTLALGKAKGVAKNLKEGIVIGIDTIVVFNDKKIGKPKSEKEAFEMLKSFSGKKHQVYSGIAIIDIKNKKEINDYEIATIEFGKMKDEEILQYIKTKEPMDKAGGYAIQGLGGVFIKKIDGDYHTIVGFPIYKIHNLLKTIGVNVLDHKKWKVKK